MEKDQLSPDARCDLVEVVCGDHDAHVIDRVLADPPGDQPGDDAGLAGAVARPQDSTPVVDDRAGDPLLTRPEVLAEHVAHPTDRIPDVWILRRIEQVGEGLPGRW